MGLRLKICAGCGERKMLGRSKSRCKDCRAAGVPVEHARLPSKPPKRKPQKKKPPQRPDYYRYIGSKAWENKRQQALKHYGNKCATCKATTNLRVHHLTYARLGQEKMSDLQVLCNDCHCNRHEGEKVGAWDSTAQEFLDRAANF